MPDLSKILLLDMDFLFFPILYSNSMPKTLYTKPTTNLSQVSQIVDGGWCLVFRWDWGLLRIICNCLPFSLVFKLSIGIIASLNLRLHKGLAKRSTH